MQPFLKEIVQYVHRNYQDDISELCLVLPNKRAGLYIKEFISDHYKITIWAPEILSITEFIDKLSGASRLDQPDLLFRFYHVYQKIEGKQAQPFEDFMKWGSVLLHDFSELDQHSVNTDNLFAFLNESYALQNWSPGQTKLTDNQKSYLKFWSSLSTYYNEFKAYLEQHNLAYDGLAYANALSNLRENNTDQGQWKHILFCGFNALSKSEDEIIKLLISEGKAEILWDADSYYMQDTNQEAGRFLRQFRDADAGQFKWEFNHLDNKEKQIRIYGVTGDVMQAKLAGQLLGQMPGDTERTAVVLANEHLLLPVLNSLPKSVEHVNVTMGLPLHQTPIHSLIMNLLTMQANAVKAKANRLYHKDLLAVLQHPILSLLDGIKAINQDIIPQIRKKNIVFISFTDIKKLSVQKSIEELEYLFGYWNNDPNKALEATRLLLEALLQKMQAGDSPNMVQIEYVQQFSNIVQRLSDLIAEYKSVESIITLKTLFNNLVSVERVNFYGEPLQGLQIMGVLETRTLDFENIILLSANEDVLPKGKTESSFIPFDIRKKFGLPTYIEKDAIFAYHFYHLLQRSKNVHLLYNNHTEGLSSGEKSRFIAQIQHELKATKISEQTGSIDIEVNVAPPVIIEKDTEVMAAVKARLQDGISITALSRYINCPLDFYYSSVIGIREKEEISDTIEAATMGTIIHDSLEALYRPLLNKPLLTRDMPDLEKNAEQALKVQFEKHFHSEFQYGRNLLLFKVALKLIKRFLSNEAKRLRETTSKNQEVRIVGLEENLMASISIGHTSVTIKGKADRIEETNSQPCILDYKTGLVEARHLKISNEASVTTDPAASNAFQLLMYAWLYQQNHPENDVMAVGIVSFRKLSEGIIPLTLDGRKEIERKDIVAFEKHLIQLLEEVLDTSKPFQHATIAKYCQFCEL